MWRQLLGSRQELQADGARNGVVDAGDYGVWRSNFGADLSQLTPQAEIFVRAANEDDQTSEPFAEKSAYGTKLKFVPPTDRFSLIVASEDGATFQPSLHAMYYCRRSSY